MINIDVSDITNIKHDFVLLEYNYYSHTFTLSYKNTVIGKNYIGIEEARAMIKPKLIEFLAKDYYFISRKK